MNPEDVEQLAEDVEKRFKTTMIGSLARIEEHLGFVWGHDQEMISVQQSDHRHIWQDLRDDILDHCNYQMRSALTDIRKFIQKSNQPNTTFTQEYKTKLS